MDKGQDGTLCPRPIIIGIQASPKTILSKEQALVDLDTNVFSFHPLIESFDAKLNSNYKENNLFYLTKIESINTIRHNFNKRVQVNNRSAV